MVRAVYKTPYKSKNLQNGVADRRRWRFDTYTDAEYVAFTDNDVIFHTWVTEETLFDGGKARVFGHCPQTETELAGAVGWNYIPSTTAAQFYFIAEFMSRRHWLEPRDPDAELSARSLSRWCSRWITGGELLQLFP